MANHRKIAGGKGYGAALSSRTASAGKHAKTGSFQSSIGAEKVTASRVSKPTKEAIEKNAARFNDALTRLADR